MIIPQTTITLLPSEDPHNKSRTLIGFPTAGGGMKYVGYDNIMSNICSILNQQLPKSQEIVNQKNDNQPLTFQIDTSQQKAQIIIYI
ncbi:MAG: hypothetical protein LBD75_00955 [Candidatus Peribacteria bacterium]|jgi:hypothetical protein|nr:hypothetical protein [Candidatus Peribacteria bacterium]